MAQEFHIFQFFVLIVFFSGLQTPGSVLPDAGLVPTVHYPAFTLNVHAPRVDRFPVQDKLEAG
jgi:hypothetical protein